MKLLKLHWLSCRIFLINADKFIATNQYIDSGINLKENSPIELRDIVLEMVDRMEEIWVSDEIDEILQNRFWSIYNINATDNENQIPLHGKIDARYSAVMLRNNSWWIY